MTIYILGTPEETAQAVDDKSLNSMIKCIAQFLCNVHHCQSDYINDSDYFDDNIPLKWNPKWNLKMSFCMSSWQEWIEKFAVNYEYLVQLGLTCCAEWEHRYSLTHNGRCKIYINENPCRCQIHKYKKIIEWARDNVPYFSEYYEFICGDGEEMKKIEISITFPLVMPKKYIHYTTNDESDTVLSYRNYYQAKLIRNYEKCTNCNNICTDNNCYTCGMRNVCDQSNSPTWTRRKKPEWLNLRG